METMEILPGLAGWERQVERLRGLSEPEPLRALRDEAFARFAATGFPTTDDEEWRLTPVSPIARASWDLATAPAPIESSWIDAHRLADAVAELVFVNGVFEASRSNPEALPEGVRFRPIAAAAASPRNGELDTLGSVAEFRDRPFVALNTALIRDGAIVEVDDGVRAGTIHLLFLTAAPAGALAATPRVLILAGRGAELTVVETHAGTGAYFSNAVTEIRAAEGAVVDHSKLIAEASKGFHVGAVDAVQGRSSTLRTRLIGLGGALVRNDVATALDGEGASCELDGLYLLRGNEHFDAHTRIVHAKPHTDSQELYKGILGDASRGVFNGVIVVRPGAQKIAARQTNKNLLLSNEAIADSNPQLEIHADDVKCNHGSTIGQLDPTALFYLRSRGIGEGDARTMLTWAFAREVVERIRVGSVRQRLERALTTRLPIGSRGKETP